MRLFFPFRHDTGFFFLCCERNAYTFKFLPIMPPKCDCGSLARHVHVGRGGAAALMQLGIGTVLNGAIDLQTAQFYNCDAPRDVVCRLFTPPPVATGGAAAPGGVQQIVPQEGGAASAPGGGATVGVGSGGGPSPSQSITTTTTTFVTSEDGGDLLFHLPMHEYIALKAIGIMGLGQGLCPDRARLYANRTDVRGFDTLRRILVDEEVFIAQTDVAEDVVYVLNKPLVFNSCKALTILLTKEGAGAGGRGGGGGGAAANVVEEQDSDASRMKSSVGRILLFGESSGRIVNPKMVGVVVYELRPNPAD